MKYRVQGFTGPNADFTDIIEIRAPIPDSFDSLYGEFYRKQLKYTLLDSNCETEYLVVFDECGGERRDDLADESGQIVFVAESMGCEICNDTADGNELTDDCDSDVPHGGFMLVFTPVE